MVACAGARGGRRSRSGRRRTPWLRLLGAEDEVVAAATLGQPEDAGGRRWPWWNRWCDGDGGAPEGGERSMDARRGASEGGKYLEGVARGVTVAALSSRGVVVRGVERLRPWCLGLLL